MPSKKKSPRSTARPAKKRRQTTAKSGVSRYSAKKKPAKKKAAKKKLAKKKLAKKRLVPKQSLSRAKGKTRSKATVSSESELKREFKRRNLTASGVASPRRSADFRGSSREERANSQSVEELVEEGNVFEAGAVAGVEEADNADEREVHTREMIEDDVPEEYLDKE